MEGEGSEEERREAVAVEDAELRGADGEEEETGAEDWVAGKRRRRSKG